MGQTEGIDLQRLRRQVSFDRLLARFFSEQNPPWLLKGTKNPNGTHNQGR
jgi:hypothetical protein